MTARNATPHRFFSPARVRAIAGNTLLEMVRLKVFYFMLLFGLLIIGSSIFLVQFSFQEKFQVLKDVSLGAMSVFTWLLAVLSTGMLLPKDVEDRTLYTILAKPVPRFEYLLGKLLGVLALLAVATVLMSGLFLAILYNTQQSTLAEITAAKSAIPDPQVPVMVAAVRASAFNINLLPGILTIYLKASIFASVTLLISTFASSYIFTVLVSIMVYFIGAVQWMARDYWLEQTAGSGLVKFLLGGVALLFPDMQPFNLVDDVAVGTAVPIGLFLQTAGLGCVYTCVYLLAAYFLFSTKEL